MGEIAGALYGLETMVEGAVALAKDIYDPTLPLKATITPINDLNLSRAYHSISIVQGRVYVFGGKEIEKDGSETLADNSVHVIILPTSGIETTNYEQIPSSSSAPPARYGHSSAVIDDQIYIFGGSTVPYSEALAERGVVWVFDTKSNSWSSLHPANDEELPAPRAYHASVATDQPRERQVSTDEDVVLQSPSDPAEHVPEPQAPSTYGTLAIYGGVTNTDKKPLSDLWAFDISTRTWSRFPSPPLSDTAPTSPAITLVDNRLYAYSGPQSHYLDFYIHNASSSNPGAGFLGLVPAMKWQAISPPSDVGPGHRLGASLIPVTTGQGRDFLLLVGGEAASVVKGDIWALQLKSEGMTAASLKDRARDAIGKETAEQQWAEVKYFDAERVMIQEGQEGKGIGERKGFAAAKASEIDGGTFVVWGGVDGAGQIMSNGLIISTEK